MANLVLFCSGVLIGIAIAEAPEPWSWVSLFTMFFVMAYIQTRS